MNWHQNFFVGYKYMLNKTVEEQHIEESKFEALVILKRAELYLSNIKCIHTICSTSKAVAAQSLKLY